LVFNGIQPTEFKTGTTGGRGTLKEEKKEGRK
jgi:hypothetical protein